MITLNWPFTGWYKDTDPIREGYYLVMLGNENSSPNLLYWNSKWYWFNGVPLRMRRVVCWCGLQVNPEAFLKDYNFLRKLITTA